MEIDVIPRRHKYIRRILAMQARGEIPPGVHTVTAAHDEMCAVWRNGYCDCDPEIRMHKGVPEELAHDQ